MPIVPEPDDVSLDALALEGPHEPPDEEVLEAVRDGLEKVHVPPPKPFFGIPRQRSRPSRSPLSVRRRRKV